MKTSTKTNKIIIGIIAGVIAILTTIFILFQTHVLCIHEWSEPTCTEPETCHICGRTQGEPLGHYVANWIIDTEPTCSMEGQQHGECVNCGKTMYEEIAKLKHTEGEWVITQEPVVNADSTVTPGTQSLLCSVCGGTIETKEYTIELTTEQQNALKYIRTALGYVHFGYDGWVRDLTEYEGFSREDAVFAADHCGLDWNEEAVKAYDQLVSEGSSMNGSKETMQYMGFTDAQIDYAMNHANS